MAPLHSDEWPTLTVSKLVAALAGLPPMLEILAVDVYGVEHFVRVPTDTEGNTLVDGPVDMESYTGENPKTHTTPILLLEVSKD